MKIPFLQLVANDLREKYGNNLSRLKIIFPNKRASLFFNDYLVSDDTPVWAPTYQTISELFRSLSPLNPIDSIEAVCRIYNIYLDLIEEEKTEDVTLDFFYGWGEMILSDFEDIDKNMVDAQRIFTNVSDYQNIDFGNFLTEEQIGVLQHFFKSFSEDSSSKIKERFRLLWNQLANIYKRLNTELQAEGLAYEGALYRQVIETLKHERMSFEANNTLYVFVGFNVLDKVEKELFTFLKKRECAIFYWDYDTYYTKEHPNMEAGRFVRENLLLFPNALGEEHFANFSMPKHIEFVAAASNNVQAAAIAPWIEQNLTEDPKRTAIVVCDENQILPVLHNLPKNVSTINVTKGFPLMQTPAYSLVEKFFREQEKQPTDSLMQLLESLSAEIKVAGIKERDAQSLNSEDRKDSIWNELYNEAYYQTYLLVNHLLEILRKGLFNSSTATTIRRLLRQLVRQTSIPFHGEPAMGLQIMGVLETRNLDFDRILLLSVNEGTLPKKASNASFIPYFIRREFGLTTYEKKTAVFAYYFYRLLQRATHLRLSYNNATTGDEKGERSRFMTQILVESPHVVHHLVLNSKQKTATCRPKAINKPLDLVDRLKHLSPTALNSYINCQLQFYYSRVLRLETPPPAPEDFQANQIGSLFHKAAELLYQDKCTVEGVVTPEALAPFIQKGGTALFNKYILRAYEEADNTVQRNALIDSIVQFFLLNLVRYDHDQAPFTIKGLEQEIYTDFSFPYKDGEQRVSIGGIIDRLDIVRHPKDGTDIYRVFDYKTGGDPNKQEIKILDDLFEKKEKRPNYAFQTLLYCLALYKKEPAHQYAPALFFTNRAYKNDYTPYLTYQSSKCYTANSFLDEFEDKLKELLEELFATEKDGQRLQFLPPEKDDVCQHCNFYNFCYQA